MNSNLVYDIGFHTGQDTDFYLRKGFDVIAVEANPKLVEQGREKFKNFVETGRLVLLNVGVGSVAAALPFYVHKEWSEWSSFDRTIGTTRGDYDTIMVPSRTLASIVLTHGTPYYLKIDIEGLDLVALESIRSIDDKPRYISVENGTAELIDELSRQGYTHFKFVNQAHVSEVTLHPPALEGIYLDYKFPVGSSGPFGNEAPGEWLTRQEVLERSNSYWSNPNCDPNVHGWFDLHARHGAEV